MLTREKELKRRIIIKTQLIELLQTEIEELSKEHAKEIDKKYSTAGFARDIEEIKEDSIPF